MEELTSLYLNLPAPSASFASENMAKLVDSVGAFMGYNGSLSAKVSAAVAGGVATTEEEECFPESDWPVWIMGKELSSKHGKKYWQ